MKDVLLCGICAFELGCVALEQGVLMEDYGMAVWVRISKFWGFSNLVNCSLHMNMDYSAK